MAKSVIALLPALAGATASEGFPVAFAAAGQCDVSSEGALCLGGGGFGEDSAAKVLLPPALPDGTAGLFTFDQAVPQDATGDLTATGQVQSGPGFGGTGASAKFSDGKFLRIEHHEKLEGLELDFTASAWVFLEDTGVRKGECVEPKWCTLMRKGGVDEGTGAVTNGPAIFFDACSRKLTVALGTDKVAGYGEMFQSNARLRPSQWMHVALVRLAEPKKTRLYINGILDAHAISEGNAVKNKDPLYIGGEPSPTPTCNVNWLVDELKITGKAMEADELAAEASPALGGVEPSFVHLACTDCTLEEAAEKCPGEYHVCSSIDLHSGAFQVAHLMGWVGQDTRIWTHTVGPNHAATHQAGIAPTNPPPLPVNQTEVVDVEPVAQPGGPAGPPPPAAEDYPPPPPVEEVPTPRMLFQGDEIPVAFIGLGMKTETKHNAEAVGLGMCCKDEF